jgi:hypothetical protein
MKQTFTLVLLFISVLAFAQPANDTPCNAIEIIVDGPVASADNTTATADPDEVVPPLVAVSSSCLTSWCNDDVAVQNSIWYSFTAPANGAVFITTCNPGSTFDSQIALWLASDCSNYSTYSWLAANDDMGGGCSNGGLYLSAISIDGLTPGATYLVQVDGWSGEVGPVEVSVVTGVPNSLVNILHTSADPALSVVDVRLDGALLLDDFNFLTCSQYLPIDASGPHTLSIHPATSADGDPALISTELNLNLASNYEIAIVGLLTETGFSSYQPLSMMLFEGAQQFTSSAGSIPLHFLHTSTDAPVVDLLNAESGATLCNDLGYGVFNAEGYQNFADNFTISVADAAGNALGIDFCIPAAMDAENGFGFTIAAVGFVNPALNNDGSPIALYLVNWTDGTLAPLQQGACLFPANDNLCNATVLGVNEPPTQADNSFATLENNESSPANLPSGDPESDCSSAWCDGSLDNTLWFSFVAPGSGCAMVSTCSADGGIDTQIALCTADDCTNPSTVIYIAANDDMINPCSGNSYSSEIQYCGLTPGTTYYVQVDGYGGELGTFFIQVTEPMGITAQEPLHALVYPNPVQESVFIQGIAAGTEIEIVNTMGQVVFRSKYASTGIDARSLQSGAYLIRVAGKTIATRFIKS